MVMTVVNKNPVVYMYVLLYFVRGLSIYKVVSRYPHTFVLQQPSLYRMKINIRHSIINITTTHPTIIASFTATLFQFVFI